jgi:hypothetical protein
MIFVGWMGACVWGFAGVLVSADRMSGEASAKLQMIATILEI